MATTKKKVSTTKQKEKLSAEKVISLYMNKVLENEQIPTSVYKFSKENGFTEQEFYRFFGSFEAVRNEIWKQFYLNSVALMNKNKAVENFSSRDKMLTFFFTFFEMLTANRSYVLFALQGKSLEELKQLKGLRKHIKAFAKDLIEADNEEKNLKLLQKNENFFSEGAWLQTLFLLKFWMDDNSAEFEKTDLAIEKSVNTIFDVFDNTPLERILDFGKFLFKEKMA